MLTAIFWKKVWSWIKHHWYFPVIIVLALVLFLLRSSSTKALFNLMQERHEQHKQEIDLLNKVAAEKSESTKEAVQSHQDLINKIEKDHNLKVEELKRQKKEEVDSLIDQHKDNPDELAKEIAKLIGAEHVDTP